MRPILLALLVVSLSGCDLYWDSAPDPGLINHTDARPPDFDDGEDDGGIHPDASPPLAACVPGDGPTCQGCTAIETMRAQMTGRWQGSVDTPADWLYPDNATLQIEFRPDGSYSVACDIGCVVMYYGRNDDSVFKRWELVDVWDNGQGYGEIDVTFSATTTQRHEMSHIEFNASASELTFEHWNGDHGPRVLHLTRCAD